MDFRRYILIAIHLATIEDDFQNTLLGIVADGLDHARFDRG
jgi:hypothetical protein